MPVYSGFWRRVGASLIDSVLVNAAIFVVGVVVALAGDGLDEKAMLGFVYVMAIAGSWLYSALMESSRHQATIGKLVVGIQVTDLDRRRIGFGRATGRHFGKILSSLALGIGYLMVAFTRRRQSLHDMIAGTLVVRRGMGADATAAGQSSGMPGWGVALLVLSIGAIPVLGILAAIAIPAYQDYAIRGQVSEGLAESGDLEWVCGLAPAPEGVVVLTDEYQQYTNVDPRYLPASCRP